MKSNQIKILLNSIIVLLGVLVVVLGHYADKIGNIYVYFLIAELIVAVFKDKFIKKPSM